MPERLAVRELEPAQKQNVMIYKAAGFLQYHRTLLMGRPGFVLTEVPVIQHGFKQFVSKSGCFTFI